MSLDLHGPRLPDVPVPLLDGGKINLSDFAGQKLIVFFCPDDSDAAAREVKAYEAMASDFEHAGAWVVGVRGARPAGEADGKGFRIHLGIDEDGAAFAALASFIPAELEVARDRGTTFLIDRDGGIRAAWPGCGHAAEALETARERP